ncbi:MAG: molybdopterin-dependent oxidoreductase [Alphaproteobacteria bacterium]
MIEKREIKGCCPLDFQDTCAWVAHVEDDKVVRVEGAKDHPFTRGMLCAKVNDYQARTYAPDRLLHPLRRTGPKGSGEFEAISWDEALDTIAARFKEIIADHGAEALMPLFYLGSMGVVQRQALMRLFHGLGASRLHGEVCGAPMSSLWAEGHAVGFDPEDMVHSRLIILWGANILSTCHHHWQPIKEARRRGAKVIAIDPRRSRTAEQCDEHIAIRPGTDAVLAAGMAQVMIAEGLADEDYIRAAAADYDAYRDQVAEWTPERVAALCGIDAETVVRLARKFAAARPAVLRSGVGPQQTVRGEAYLRGLSALSLLGGHWRHPGGGLFVFDVPVFDEFAAGRADLATGPTRSLDLSAVGPTLTDDDTVKGLMVWCMNPAVIQVDTARVRRGLARDDLFTVVLEHFMTDTARYADIILPATTQLEHFDILGSWGHHYISVNNPAVAPQGEAKSHGEVMRLLAPRLGLEGPAYEDSDEAIAAVALPPEVSLAELKKKGWHKASPPRPDPAATGGLRLTGEALEPLDVDGLRLLTPKSHYFLNSSFANMPRQRKAMGPPTVEINPVDADARGLVDGEPIALRNHQGEIHAVLEITDRICPGALAMAGKWWSEPAETAAVANLLSPSSWSPGGQPAYNDTFVEVVAIEVEAAAE